MRKDNKVTLKIPVYEKCRHGMMFQSSGGAIYMLVRTERDYLGLVSLTTGQSWKYENYHDKLLHEVPAQYLGYGKIEVDFTE